MTDSHYSRAYEILGRGRTLVVLGLILAAFVLGYYVSGPKETSTPTADVQREAAKKPAAEAKKPSLWTCSMHPQIRLPNPGKCPICFMDLIPLETGKEDLSDTAVPRYSMSKAAKKLAEVETAEVKRDHAKVSVRMVGMVAEDETRVAALTSRVEGRLDEIYVTFTGVLVNRGDPMVKIWSPTLIKSQVELFETLRGKDEDPGVIKGAEEKLIQQGLTDEQIKAIKEKKKPDLYVTLKAPISGIVTRKMALLGQFVKEGQEMYFINDLSQVWIRLDAYETDMPWIRYGQDVTFTTPSVPGRTFRGKVLFIDPMLTTMTRSVKIRVEAANPDFLLKPGMFVSAELDAEVDAAGKVIKSEWVAKYICPTHPSDTPSAEPGTCPDSKMQLRPASAFGYATDAEPRYPLIIPATAPLITGERAIVYVEDPNTERRTYEGREVVLGPRAGDRYVVYEGLKEGERVVTRGNFKIDSAMQILARPSMMRPADAAKAKTPPAKAEEELVEKVTAPADFLAKLSPVVEEYLRLKEALVEEKTEEAARHAQALTRLFKGMDAGSLDQKASAAWKSLSGTIVHELEHVAESQDVQKQRTAFDAVSENFVKLVMSFRHVMKDTLVVFHCPMAFDSRGAYWVEAGEERRNPYFGHTRYKGQDMLQCAELVEKIPPERVSEAGQDAGTIVPDKNPVQSEPAADTPAGKPAPSGQGHEEGKK
jgi:membrane fusion protein, copper/silver efflux system